MRHWRDKELVHFKLLNTNLMDDKIKCELFRLNERDLLGLVETFGVERAIKYLEPKPWHKDVSERIRAQNVLVRLKSTLFTL